MKKVLWPFLVLVIILGSCKKYRCPETVYCNNFLNFVLVGFDTSDVSTVVFRVYAAGTNFGTLVDTAVALDTVLYQSFNGPVYPWVPLSGNSTDSLLNGTGALTSYRSFSVDTDYIAYDWEIYLPKDGRTIKISAIQFSGSTEQTVETCDEKGNKIGGFCQKNLTSYVVDGETYKNVNSGINNNFIFLKK